MLDLPIRWNWKLDLCARNNLDCRISNK